jgi:hypothetical protein
MSLKRQRCIFLVDNRKCKRLQNNNGMCFQHYDKIYISKDSETIVKEVLNEIILKICDEEKEVCNICLEDIDDQVNINPLCCKGKQHYHYQCIEKQLCYYSETLSCPVCKYQYTKEDIKTLFTEDQKKIMLLKLNNIILKRKKKVTKCYKIFQYHVEYLKKYKNYLNRNLGRIDELMAQFLRCEEVIENRKNKLSLLYERLCKECLKIEIQLTKMNKIEKNANKTIKLFDEMKSYKDYMSYMIDEFEEN